MSGSAVELSGLRAVIDPEALAERRLSVALEGAVIRLAGPAIAHAAPALARAAGLPIALERIQDGSLFGQVNFKGLKFTAEVRPVVTPEGSVRLEMRNVRAVGFIPLPPTLAMSAIRAGLADLPGLTPGEDYLELDPAVFVRAKLAQITGERVSVSLPPVRNVRAEADMLEIEF